MLFLVLYRTDSHCWKEKLPIVLRVWPFGGFNVSEFENRGEIREWFGVLEDLRKRKKTEIFNERKCQKIDYGTDGGGSDDTKADELHLCHSKPLRVWSQLEFVRTLYCHQSIPSLNNSPNLTWISFLLFDYLSPSLKRRHSEDTISDSFAIFSITLVILMVFTTVISILMVFAYFWLISFNNGFWVLNFLSDCSGVRVGSCCSGESYRRSWEGFTWRLSNRFGFYRSKHQNIWVM